MGGERSYSRAGGVLMVGLRVGERARHCQLPECRAAPLGEDRVCGLLLPFLFLEQREKRKLYADVLAKPETERVEVEQAHKRFLSNDSSKGTDTKAVYNVHMSV